MGFAGEKWWKSHENVEKSHEFPMKMMGNHHFSYENEGNMCERHTFWMRMSGIFNAMGEAWSYFMGFGGGLIMGLNGNLIHNDNLIHLDLV